MKNLHSLLLLLAIFVCLVDVLHAQSDTSINRRKTSCEMGMNVDALTLRPGDFYSQYHTILDNQVFSGLYFKHFRGKNALRFSIDYSQRSFYYGQMFTDRDWNQARSLEIKAGYQRMLGKRKLAAYFFTDLGYNHLRRKIDNSWYYPVPIYSDYYYNPVDLISYNIWFLSPGFGLRWKVYKTLVLNLESGVQLFYAREYSSNSPGHRNASIGMNVQAVRLTFGFTF